MNEKNQILSTVGLYHAVNDGAVSAIPLLFPVFKILFNLNYTQVGIITGGGLLIALIAQIAIGRIADGRDFRFILSLGLILLSGSLLLLTQANNFFTLVIFIFIVRIGSAFFHPVGIGWISKTFKTDRVDWAMGIQSGFGDLGAFIAILTTLYLVELYGWSFPIYIWAMAGAAIVLCCFYLTRKINMEPPAKKYNDLKYRTNNIFKETLMMLKKIKLLIPAFIISGSTWGMVVSYFPLLLVERTTLSLTYIGFILATWIGAGTIVTFYYGKIQKFLSRKTVVLFAYLAMGITGFALAFFTNIILIIIAVSFLGISLFLTFPALFSFVSEVTHESVEGRTFGVTFTLQLGGGTFLLFLGGVFSDIWGIWTPFAMIGILSLVVLIIFLINNNKPYANTIEV